jgi:hypothetical protein
VLFTLPDDRHYHTKLVSHMISIKEGSAVSKTAETSTALSPRSALAICAAHSLPLFVEGSNPRWTTALQRETTAGPKSDGRSLLQFLV